MNQDSLTPKVSVTTTKEHHLKLTREMIIAMLRLQNLRLADDAVIFVHITGEGIYADKDFQIRNNIHLEVKWKTTEKTG